jgi:triacylglycerol lipase
VDVVGYSMGGLIAAYLLKFLDRGKRIRSVVTLGTPHRGSPAVLLARALLGRLSSSMGQMVPDSDFLQELSAAEVPIGSRLVSIASFDDGVVPTLYSELARRPRQHTRRIAGVSHLGFLFSRDAIDEVAAQLNQREGMFPLAKIATVHVLRPRGAL